MHPIRRRVAAVIAVLILSTSAGGAGELLRLHVDAREAPRRILRATITIPAAPGVLTLHYPKWLPGEHGPTGPITSVAGPRLRAAGRDVPWRRDALDMYAITCDVPEGATEIEAALDVLLTTSQSGFTAGGSTSERLLDLSWNHVLLYPAGREAAELMVAASLELPAGWQAGTALSEARAEGGRLTFEPVSLETLVDSPVVAGAHFRRIPLRRGKSPTHELCVVADEPAALEIPDAYREKLDGLMDEALHLFGAHHYRHYRFLLTLSDHVAHFGLEHHESSDNRVKENGFVDEDARRRLGALLAHELVHSWNGKHRRPADMLTPTFHEPQRTELLWVYEGLTEYLGFVLTARSGLQTIDERRQVLARDAAALDNGPARAWRPLRDTAAAAQLLFVAPDEWTAWRRSVDFYDEGVLIWLEADVRIRQATGGRKSLDDFCRAFHGGVSGPPSVRPFTLDDLVSALEAVAPVDWRSFFEARLSGTSARAPLGGVEGSGWRIVFRGEPSAMQKASDADRKQEDATYSLGILVDENGGIKDVIPGRPADAAGMAPGMKLLAVNGRKYSAERLRAALVAGAGDGPAVEVVAENGDFVRTFRLDYHGGPRYPHLERDPARPDLLSRILEPRARR